MVALVRATLTKGQSSLSLSYFAYYFGRPVKAGVEGDCRKVDGVEWDMG